MEIEYDLYGPDMSKNNHFGEKNAFPCFIYGKVQIFGVFYTIPVKILYKITGGENRRRWPQKILKKNHNALHSYGQRWAKGQFLIRKKWHYESP